MPKFFFSSTKEPSVNHFNESFSLLRRWSATRNICETCNYVLMKPDSSRCTTAASCCTYWLYTCSAVIGKALSQANNFSKNNSHNAFDVLDGLNNALQQVYDPHHLLYFAREHDTRCVV